MVDVTGFCKTLVNQVRIIGQHRYDDLVTEMSNSIGRNLIQIPDVRIETTIGRLIRILLLAQVLEETVIINNSNIAEEWLVLGVDNYLLLFGAMSVKLPILQSLMLEEIVIEPAVANNIEYVKKKCHNELINYCVRQLRIPPTKIDKELIKRFVSNFNTDMNDFEAIIRSCHLEDIRNNSVAFWRIIKSGRVEVNGKWMLLGGTNYKKKYISPFYF